MIPILFTRRSWPIAWLLKNGRIYQKPNWTYINDWKEWEQWKQLELF